MQVVCSASWICSGCKDMCIGYFSWCKPGIHGVQVMCVLMQVRYALGASWISLMITFLDTSQACQWCKKCVPWVQVGYVKWLNFAVQVRYAIGASWICRIVTFCNTSQSCLDCKSCVSWVLVRYALGSSWMPNGYFSWCKSDMCLEWKSVSYWVDDEPFTHSGQPFVRLSHWQTSSIELVC